MCEGSTCEQVYLQQQQQKNIILVKNMFLEAKIRIVCTCILVEYYKSLDFFR